MSKPSQYLLVSLPSSIVPSHHRDDALEAVSVTVSPDNGSVASFPIPEFKIGTLDALVQQADELAKLEGQCQAVVGKVGDALKNILEGDEAQIERMKVVNDSKLPRYRLPSQIVSANASQSRLTSIFAPSSGTRSSTVRTSRSPS